MSRNLKKPTPACSPMAIANITMIVAQYGSRLKKEDIAPQPTADVPATEIHNFGDIYAAFDPAKERYD